MSSDPQNLDQGCNVFSQFVTALAKAIDRIGEGACGPLLDDALRVLVPFDNSMVFAYAPGQRPLAVSWDIENPQETAIIMHKYVKGPYLLDPFYEEVRRGRVSGLARLVDIAPDEFSCSEYYEQHYRRTRIVDEIGFFMGLPGNATAVLSITRRGNSEKFTEAESAILAQSAELICAIGRKNWSAVSSEFEAKSEKPLHDDLLGPTERTLLSLKQDILSDRQAEVIGYVLKGHSTESIAINLNISSETVKVHRRNAYANLGISSQAELFSIFIEQLSKMIPPADALGIDQKVSAEIIQKVRLAQGT